MTAQDITIRAGRATLDLFGRAARLVQGYFRRRGFQRLRDLDDHILDDIGVTRTELEIATRLPFSRDAAAELRELARRRRRGESEALTPLDRDVATRLYGKTLEPRRWL